MGGANVDAFRPLVGFLSLLPSTTLEVNVSRHANVRRSQSLQNPSESAVISWPRENFGDERNNAGGDRGGQRRGIGLEAEHTLRARACFDLYPVGLGP